MPRPVVCPHCREELDIPSDLRRREVRCAACRNTFVPDADGGEAPPVAGPTRSPRPLDEFDDEPRRPRRRTNGGGNRTVWLLVLGMLGCCGLGCGGFCVFSLIVAFPDFEPFDSATGRFHAEFPGQPTEFKDKNEDALDRHNTEFRRGFPPETYFVRYVDLKADDKRDAAVVLKEAGDRALQRVPGTKEVSRSTSTVGGNDATDLMLRHPDGTITVTRAILVEPTVPDKKDVKAKKRLYVIGMTGAGLKFDTPHVSRFLDGFRIQAEPESKANEAQ